SDARYATGECLTFSVASVIIKEKLRGTSFENWINYPLTDHCMTGEVTITLDKDAPILRLSYHLISTANQYARYVRGPWLKVGQDAFGVAKDDAILPGVEWLQGDEWSSGTDWFKDPWAMRFVPHPNKVAIPLMALSHDGVGIGLAWNPNQVATQWFNYRQHHPQPVFASPNFLDRRNNHLMGLMIPDVDVEDHENKIYAEPPLELHPDQRIDFDVEIFLVAGNSLDVVTDWVKRHGLPAIEPCWPLPAALDRIATAYNSHFWQTGKGFGNAQLAGGFHPTAPRFAARYIETHAGSTLAEQLHEKLEWCRQQPDFHPDHRNHTLTGERDELLARGRTLLSYQREDGSFPFDPDNRHYVKDDFVVARTYLEPMGLAGDTALDITILPVIDLLALADATGDDAFRAGARKALDYCLSMSRPEGGDFWETPLHSPNLFAAGHAAIAYELGHRAFGDVRYRARGIYWIRSLLPFTHLWQPRGMPMLYNTKPCLCSSDWYFANWVRDHVQWEVLETFAESLRLGIDWGAIDPEIDWHRYHEGITVAALRWMIDHTLDIWRPHNLPETLPAYRQGLMDGLFADTHNSTTGNYGGAGIMPDVIAVNLMDILDWQANT
ncbi:MAG: hypothetical protein M1546_25950, partial [Chloroflexi bacterium]|nr:hypothetical protein [Chloroflexota bacterium]